MCVCMCVRTSAGASVGGHAVAVLGTGALVAAGHVHTLVGAQVTHTLRTLVDVWWAGGRREGPQSVKAAVYFHRCSTDSSH